MRALLFDLYDTLVWADWVALRAGRDQLAVRAGAEAAAMREQWVVTHDRRMRGLNRGLEGDLEAMLTACGVACTPDLLRELATAEFGNWAGGVRLYDDVLPELRRFREAAYRLGIVSNASCEAGTVVRALGLDCAVDAVVLSCDVGALKPEPEILEAALERLQVGPSDALFVDDVPANLDAAATLGLATALMARPAHDSHSPGGAPELVRTADVARPRGCAVDGTGHPRVTRLSEVWQLL